MFVFVFVVDVKYLGGYLNKPLGGAVGLASPSLELPSSSSRYKIYLFLY